MQTDNSRVLYQFIVVYLMNSEFTRPWWPNISGKETGNFTVSRKHIFFFNDLLGVLKKDGDKSLTFSLVKVNT